MYGERLLTSTSAKLRATPIDPQFKKHTFGHTAVHGKVGDGHVSAAAFLQEEIWQNNTNQQAMH